MDADDRETEHQESRATAGRYGNTSAKCANHIQTASSPFILGKVCRGSPKRKSVNTVPAAHRHQFFSLIFLDSRDGLRRIEGTARIVYASHDC